MKIPPIKNCKPVRFVRALYYANKPMPMYKPLAQKIELPKEQNSFVKWLRKIFK